jgi:hypothetical protein
MRHDQISSRRQCLKTAAVDAFEWAQQSDGEVFNDLVQKNDGTPPDAEDYATALQRYDGDFTDSPASAAGVPPRWAPIYDAALTRVYRAAVRRRVAEILDDE